MGKKIMVADQIPIPDKKKGKIMNMMESLRSMASVLTERASLAARMGKSFGTNRDLYAALGYTKFPTFDDYYSKYIRQDIAKAIVEALPNACWRKKPIVTELNSDPGKLTKFEEEWNTLIKDFSVWHYLTRADRIAGIGQYGVMLIGYQDGKELREPVENASELLYLRPYNENNAEISTWVEDSKDPRYGKPETYKLRIRTALSNKSTSTSNVLVHHSRVIHIAEGLTDDDILGTPRLRPVLNRLNDLDLVAGGSAEMFWRGAFPGYGFKQDADATMDPQDMDDLEDEIQKYMHNLERFIRLKGISVENLTTQVADPSNHVSVLVDLISAATRIPKRILMGSERGELASSQDERSWDNRVDERRRDFCEPMILRPFIDDLISAGVLSSPAEEYVIVWPDISVPTEKETAEVVKIKTEAFAKYVSSPGADQLIPPEIYLKTYLGHSDEEIQEMMELVVEPEEEPEEEEEE